MFHVSTVQILQDQAMTMGINKCFVCFNSFQDYANIEERTKSINEGTNPECKSIANQLEVIFLVRKLLEIPNDICCKFLQDYGDPRLWIYCCNLCSVLVDKARSIFDQISLLEKQFENLKSELKSSIAFSVKSQEYAYYYEYRTSEDAGDIMRTLIFKEYEKTEESDPASPPEVKVEPNQNYIREFDINYPDSPTPIDPTSIKSSSYDDGYGCGSLPLPDQDIREKKKTDKKTKDRRTKRRNKTEENIQSIKEEEIEMKDSSYVESNSANNDENENSYKCYECGQQFANLKQHVISVHGLLKRQCHFCGKVLSTPKSLMIHLRIHTGEKPCICADCGKGFGDPTSLTFHKRFAHTGETPYKCDTCGKRYRVSSHLTIHKRSHTGERPYKCQFCDKTYLNSSALNSHTNTHTKAKPFECQFCRKCFNYANTLKLHVLRHTGEKPHECDICGKKFRQTSVLKTHRKKHIEFEQPSGYILP